MVWFVLLVNTPLSLSETHYRADQKFRANWGVRSLAQNESMYSLDFEL